MDGEMHENLKEDKNLEDINEWNRKSRRVWKLKRRKDDYEFLRPSSY